MNQKFLITLLTSSNEKLLKLCYDTVINQKNHNLHYTIIIVVNSLDSDYYKNVSQEFKNIDVQIIQTQSNGKPGMGHNSVINIFKNHKQYDYLIPIDGDDFLYPYAFHQLQKSLPLHPDILALQGNDVLCWNNDSSTSCDIYLNNGFYLTKQHDYKINKWKGNKHIVNKNPFIENSFITPIRTILCSRKIFDYNINHFYCENCKVLDDYLFYLHFLNFFIKKQLNIYVINSNHIYLYNDLNLNSVHHQYTLDDDYKFIKQYSQQFDSLNTQFGISWDNLQLPFIYQNPPLKETYTDYKLVDGEVQIINYNQYLQSPNSIYCIDFANHIILQLYQIFKHNIDTLLLNQKYQQSYQLCSKLIQNGIHDRELFNYYCISAYFLKNYNIVQKYILYALPLCNNHSFLQKFL